MSTIEKASDYAHEAAENIAGGSAQAAKVLSEKGEQCRDAEQKFMKECCHYVSEHPMTSIGLAVAAGYMLRALLGEHR